MEEENKTAIQDRHFKIDLVMRGIDVGNAAGQSPTTCPEASLAW